MKPAPFAYVRADSLQQVFELLNEYHDDAKILAGGQSLMPTLNMRLSSPQVLIDINALQQLSEIVDQGDSIRVGALTRYVALERSALIAEKLPLVAQALPHIAHPAIRNRGTIGGSIAFADPAAELPACTLALQAQFVLQDSAGERRVTAEDFFLGLYETALNPGELVTAIEFPKAVPGSHSRFSELSRRHGDYAMAGLAAQIVFDGELVSDARLAFFGVSDRPRLSRNTAQSLLGAKPTPGSIERAQQTLADELEPMQDLQASAATKLHWAQVLLKRMLTAEGKSQDQ